jgi:hypothetical protein
VCERHAVCDLSVVCSACVCEQRKERERERPKLEKSALRLYSSDREYRI